MNNTTIIENFHGHVFLGEGHETSERRTWAVIWLCGAMMLIEIVGGLLFGSIAVIADGLHMSTHAGALLLAALAYTFARKHADNRNFTFGTGKFGDLAGFSSAIVLAMIALLIGFESVIRLFAPVAIHFAQAIPIAVVGLAVNIASAWLLSGGDHHHGHSHGRSHGDHHPDESQQIELGKRTLRLDVFEDGVPPRFRIYREAGPELTAAAVSIETKRPDGSLKRFAMANRGDFLESVDEIPEPHQFSANVNVGKLSTTVEFVEHEHTHASVGSDNNMRAAIVHVLADAAVSVLVIIGLFLAWVFGWLWMDPLAGIVGSLVIANWAYGLVIDTGTILLDMNPDKAMTENLRQSIESDGDRIADLHVWRLGPGHLGAVISVVTSDSKRDQKFYRKRLSRFRSLSHLTIEVELTS